MDGERGGGKGAYKKPDQPPLECGKLLREKRVPGHLVLLPGLAYRCNLWKARQSDSSAQGMYVLSTCRAVCCTRLVCLSAYYFARGDSLGSGDMVLLAVTVWFMLVIYRASVHVRPRPAGAQCREQSRAKAKSRASKLDSPEDGLSMELRKGRCRVKV